MPNMGDFIISMFLTAVGVVIYFALFLFIRELFEDTDNPTLASFVVTNFIVTIFLTLSYFVHMLIF